MKAKTNMEGKYSKKCTEVRVAQTQKKCSIEEKNMKDEIEVCIPTMSIFNYHIFSCDTINVINLSCDSIHFPYICFPEFPLTTLTVAIQCLLFSISLSIHIY